MNLTSQLKTAFMIACFFVVNRTMAQNTQTDTLNKFTGTWVGVATKQRNENEIYRPYSVSWRIHRIDNSKNQIELTEIGQRFESYDEIKKTKRATYKGNVDKDSLFIEIRNHTSKSKYLVKLGLKQNEGHSALVGTVEHVGTNESMMFLLTKISDDTSKYITPIKSTQVIITPPPPPEN